MIKIQFILYYFSSKKLMTLSAATPLTDDG